VKIADARGKFNCANGNDVLDLKNRWGERPREPLGQGDARLAGTLAPPNSSATNGNGRLANNFLFREGFCLGRRVPV
jgi:hypothetical protein